jgi:thiol:disulfide interchange protein
LNSFSTYSITKEGVFILIILKLLKEKLIYILYYKKIKFMMNGQTEAPEQEIILNKREYYKNYYKNNKEAITQNKKKYETKLKEERIQSLEILKKQREERGEIIDIREKRKYIKIKTEPQQRKIYDTKHNFHNMTEEEKKLRKQELKTYYNSKYNEKRKIKKKEEQQERIKEKEELKKQKEENEILKNKLKLLNNQ